LGVGTINLGGGQYPAVAAGVDLASLYVELARALPGGHRLALEGGGVHLRGCVSLQTEVADVQVREPLMTITVGTCLAASLQWSRARADVCLPVEWPCVDVIRIAGASCDENDSLQLCFPDAALERRRAPRPGERLALHDVSPYAIGRRFAFNGVPVPAIFIVRDDVLLPADDAIEITNS
jgi:diaminopimelate decarboxylase